MKQINKSIARKLYKEGKPFIIVPANMRPDSIFATTMKASWIKACNKTFDTFYNEYCYYNCNSEAGRYPRFYVEE